MANWLLASVCFFSILSISNGLQSSMNYTPGGLHTLLYEPGEVPLMHLDQDTFEDTVLAKNKTTSFMVEFYADWCGHCRAFIKYMKNLAYQVRGWEEVNHLSVINCADPYNDKVCSKNDIKSYPTLKYFPRNADNYSDAKELMDFKSTRALRTQLAYHIVEEANANQNYTNWPNFSYIDIEPQKDAEDPWSHFHSNASYTVIIFEEPDSVSSGSLAILDLWKYRNNITVRLAEANSLLATALSVQSVPYAVLLKRGDKEPLFKGPYEAFNQIVNETHFNLPDTHPPPEPKIEVIDCENKPDKCAKLYYVSELDMLKALRMALVDEVIRGNEYIQGKNLTNLLNFVTLLADHLPTKSSQNINLRAKRSADSQTLTQSQNAKEVFAGLRDKIKKSKSISSQKWNESFVELEKKYDNPFPLEDEWQHCNGSRPIYRGYTCGLWTAFHTLTVHAFLDSNDSKKYDPIWTLKSIRGWVSTFFECSVCRRHFIEMTTEDFPIDKKNVKKCEDGFMYLWKAHNRVNKRLHENKDTEDPQFVKRQFPASFLCKECHAEDGKADEKKVKEFLVNYYSKIKPYNKE